MNPALAATAPPLSGRARSLGGHVARTLGRAQRSISCALLGHRVDVCTLGPAPHEKRCSCGKAFLGIARPESRIRHVVSCFLLGHAYVELGARDGYQEYACTVCGHPLLFELGRNPYGGRRRFTKKVRYLCNLFGHSVRHVTERAGRAEYACGCGHTFLKPERGLARVTHPLVCLFAGHFVHFVVARRGYAEYSCRNCGHTFCFESRPGVA